MSPIDRQIAEARSDVDIKTGILLGQDEIKKALLFVCVAINFSPILLFATTYFLNQSRLLSTEEANMIYDYTAGLVIKLVNASVAGGIITHGIHNVLHTEANKKLNVSKAILDDLIRLNAQQEPLENYADYTPDEPKRIT